MPELYPFQALRYSPSFDLQKVTSPPYDVISPEVREQLKASDPHNFVHVTLGGDHPSGPVSDARYSTAAANLREWIDEGVLVYDSTPQFYLYAMDHSRGTTVGIMGVLQLAELGAKDIFGHERTMPSPKADRLELMRTTRANLEPLWFFASSALNGFDILVEQTLVTPPTADVTDGTGVRHRMWPIDPVKAGPADQVTRSILSTPLVVADGHHRYETALTYQTERRQTSGDGPWDTTLALIVDPVVYPASLLAIHRLVDDLSLGDLDVPLEPFNGDVASLEKEVLKRGSGHVGFASTGGSSIAKTTGNLDTQWLAEILVGKTVRYEHDIEEVGRAVAAGSVGFLLAPVTMPMVAEQALSGIRMPPKTTLFWPKPLSGLISRDLDV
ncbi:MAG: DUF1015 domain-containing protein [Actinomycetota bacterium]